MIHRELIPVGIDWQLVLMGEHGRAGARRKRGARRGGWSARPRFSALPSLVSVVGIPPA